MGMMLMGMTMTNLVFHLHVSNDTCFVVQDAHPLYKYMKQEVGGLLGSFIKWNFSKVSSRVATSHVHWPTWDHTMFAHGKVPGQQGRQAGQAIRANHRNLGHREGRGQDAVADSPIQSIVTELKNNDGPLWNQCLLEKRARGCTLRWSARLNSFPFNCILCTAHCATLFEYTTDRVTLLSEWNKQPREKPNECLVHSSVHSILCFSTVALTTALW